MCSSHGRELRSHLGALAQDVASLPQTLSCGVQQYEVLAHPLYFFSSLVYYCMSVVCVGCVHHKLSQDEIY